MGTSSVVQILQSTTNSTSEQTVSINITYITHYTGQSVIHLNCRSGQVGFSRRARYKVIPNYSISTREITANIEDLQLDIYIDEWKN